MSKTRVTFALPDDLYDAGRAIAAKRGISMAQLVREYLLELAARQRQIDRRRSERSRSSAKLER